MLQQALRFGLVGLVNTAVGYAVVLAALAAGFGDVASNALGYAVGMLFAFVLNRNWAFAAGQSTPSASRPRQLALYSAAFAVCYGINLVVLWALRIGGAIPSPIAQLAAMATYTVCFFFLCRGVVFAKFDFRIKGALSSSGFWLVVATAIGAVLALELPVCHDVVWQYWIARQINHGVQLYSQINEVNPPLWFWMALPIDRLGSWLNVSPTVLGQLAIVVLSAACFMLSERLLPPGRFQKIFLFNAFALGLIIAFGNFAQREQIAMIAVLPYTLLTVKRSEGDEVSNRLTCTVGAVAAAGLALKHYFIAVPALLELWLLLEQRKTYKPFRPETLTLVGAAAIYGIAIWLFAPAFITKQMPMDLVAYRGYSRPWASLIYGRQQFLWVLCIAVCLGCGVLRKRYFSPLAIGLCMAMGGFFLAYLAQEKNWFYHAMPVTFFLLLGLMAVGARVYEDRHDRARAGMFLPLLALGYLLPITAGPYSSVYAAATNRALAGTPRGSSVYILSSDAQKSWPMVVNGGYVWPSRYMSLWMTPAIAAKLGDSATLSKLSNEIRQNTAIDLECRPPETLLIDRATINPVLMPLHFDFRAYFAENADARNLLSHYRLARVMDGFFVYHLDHTSPIPTPAGCRQIY